MRPGLLLLLMLLVLCAPAVRGGQVVSALRRRSPPSSRQAVGSSLGGSALAESTADLDEFKQCIRRLRNEPAGASLLRTLLGYIERVRVQPHRKTSHHICQWEPGFRAFVSASPVSLHCLIAAGWSEQHTDARGTPYLLMRRSHAATLSALGALCRAELADAEREGPQQEAELPQSLLAEARAVQVKPASTPAPERGGADSATDQSEDALERPMIEQLQGMISGLISELERHSTPMNGTADESNATDGRSGSGEPQQRVPVHFRVYRSPSFPGIAGMGLPFMPGGGGGGDSDEEGEVSLLERRLREANLPAEAEEAASRELKRLRRMSPMHSEYSTLIDYVEWLAELPWNNASAEMLSVKDARKQLEGDHYAMDSVKKRVLEFLAVCQLRGDTKGSIMCLLGPPGIGKTSLGKSVATALGRDFHRISLGGVHSEAEVRGHRRTYVGAMPGLVMQAIKKCGSNNAVIMLDEIDKLGRNSVNGDPASAMLEILDPEQNQHFRDHFLALPFNLSRILFIATANDIEGIPRALRDRMEVIEMNGYTVDEKVEIAKRHLLPKQQALHGLPQGALGLTDAAIDHLVSGYTREAGVRELDRQVASLCRASAVRRVEEREGEGEGDAESEGDAEGESARQTVRGAQGESAASGARVMGVDEVVGVLGPPKFEALTDVSARLTTAGTALGLAWLPFGGEVLVVEATIMGGKGQLQLTGQLGEVMQESAKAALSWIRTHAPELGLAASSTEHLLSKSDLHIHFPAGAIQKDGPSAGVTATTAMVSALTGRLVRRDTAMTGEVTLRGVVLPVGGVKEKVIAAHRAGLRRVILPDKNEKDLRELPKTVQQEMWPP